MNLFFLLYVVCVTLRGLCEGGGLLVDDQLYATLGGKVMFTTTLTPQEPPVTFKFLAWQFNFAGIINFTEVLYTAPQYEGRTTLFRSTGSLELRNLALNDSGDYTVFILTSNGFKTGGTKLWIYEPVSNVMITTMGTDLVEFNSSVSLSCSSSGSSLSFLWLNGSSEVTASDRVQLTDGGATLTIVKVTRYDQGPFRCQVQNPVSNGTSDPVNLSISFGPENISLSLSPSGDYHEDGSNVSLTCSAVSTPVAEFHWILNGDKLSDTGPELNINMNQNGSYSCQAFNSITKRSQTSQPAVISVLMRISGASVKSTTNQAVEGNSESLTCEADGSVFSRRWTKDGSELIPTDNMILNSEESVLSFQPLTRTQSGEYSCTITNPVNSEEAKYAMVVNYGPENVQITGPREINVEHTVTLSCSAESTPPANYTWLLNMTETLSNSSVFTKNVAEFSDSGFYTCTATNDVTGRTSSAVHELSVTVQRLPRCSSGCTAGIVIACCAAVGLCAGAWYCVSQRKKQIKALSHRDTETGGGGQNNTASLRKSDVTYADMSIFQSKDGGKVQLEVQNN